MGMIVACILWATAYILAGLVVTAFMLKYRLFDLTPPETGAAKVCAGFIVLTWPLNAIIIPLWGLGWILSRSK